MKKLQNNFTTPEQSKRLLELGLPADSADCAYRGQYMPITILSPNELYSTHEKEVHDLETKRDRREGRFQTCEPCWSVGRLMEIYLTCALEYNPYDDFYTETPSLHLMAFDKDRLIEEVIEIMSEDEMDFSKLEEWL